MPHYGITFRVLCLILSVFLWFFGNYSQILAEILSWMKVLAELYWKIHELGQDFDPIRPFLRGFCLQFLKFPLSCEKSAELASKFASVRPKKRSELDAQNRKILPCFYMVQLIKLTLQFKFFISFHRFNLSFFVYFRC